VVRLLEGQIPFRVGVVAEEVGDLFQNQDHPDGGQEALDDTGWEERSEEPGPDESQADLDQTRKHHRQEERRERPKCHDLGGEDRRQTGGRAADAGVRSAQHPHEDATDDPGQYPESNGAPDASAIPRHKGTATRNTTKPDVRSRGKVADNGPFVCSMEPLFFFGR
jgi:hypothetical protein